LSGVPLVLLIVTLLARRRRSNISRRSAPW
jgi:hypothetical protein